MCYGKSGKLITNITRDQKGKHFWSQVKVSVRARRKYTLISGPAGAEILSWLFPDKVKYLICENSSYLQALDDSQVKETAGF